MDCILRLSTVRNMAWCTLNVSLFLLFLSKSLATLNVMNAVSNLTSLPLESILTNIKDFNQLASENGYHTETHTVVTNDGYILTMFRIPPVNICAKKTPILLMHDLLEESENFILSGPDSPGFLLARECYDVWFGNSRGNHNSRKHMDLNPDKDLKFWKFSVDEMGTYDVPAMVDYILDATDTKKLIYIGFSEGGGSFFIMNSERTGYADKISLFIGLAPATRQYYTKSVLYRTGTVAVKFAQKHLETAGIWEVLSRGMPIQTGASTFCQVKTLAAILCSKGLALVDSSHPGSITPETYKEVFQHDPAGTSIQNLAKYGQAMNNLKFVKFDYGAEHNMEVYGTAEPPEFDLKATTVPTVIFHGLSDHLVDTRDLDWAVAQLPNVLEYIRVKDPLWNHFDMVYSQNWKNTIFNKLKTYLSNYSDNY